MDSPSAELAAIGTIKQGDIQGLEELVRLYHLHAVRVAYAITNDKSAAEDCVADAFLAVYDRIGQFDVRRAFAPWFYRIVTNAALRAADKSRRLQFSVPSEPQMDPSPGPELAALTEETHNAVIRAISGLPAKQRAAVVLRYYLDMNERVMAQTLGCPIGTVKWHLHAARKRLRESGTLNEEVDMRLMDHKGELI